MYSATSGPGDGGRAPVESLRLVGRWFIHRFRHHRDRGQVAGIDPVAGNRIKLLLLFWLCSRSTRKTIRSLPIVLLLVTAALTPVYLALRIGQVLSIDRVESITKFWAPPERVGSLTYRLQAENLSSKKCRAI